MGYTPFVSTDQLSNVLGIYVRGSIQMPARAVYTSSRLPVGLQMLCLAGARSMHLQDNRNKLQVSAPVELLNSSIQ